MASSSSKMSEPEPVFKKRRMGGIQQRLKQAEEDRTVPSELHTMLMTMYAQGHLSGLQVHSIATAAQTDIDKVQQGYKLQGLNNVSKLKHGKNLGGSIHRLLSKESNLPLPFEVQIPFKGHPEGVQTKSIFAPS